MNHVKDRNEKENKARLSQLRNSKEHLRIAVENLTVRQSQERKHSNAPQDLDTDFIRRLVMSRMGDVEFYHSLKRLIQSKTEEENNLVESLKRDVEILQRQHAGYTANTSQRNNRGF